MGNLEENRIGNLSDPKLPYDYMNREHGTVDPDASRHPFRWVSEIAYKNIHRIVTRGYDTTELVEEGYGVIDVMFVDFQARIPTEEEEQMLNYILILSLEDGLSMPAAMSRLTARSKTFLTQACGASILAFGHAYGAYAAIGTRLADSLKKVHAGEVTLEEAAAEYVREFSDDEAFGVSDLMLKDPAAKRLLARAVKLGVAGESVALMEAIVEAAREASADAVDIDLLGAIAAVMADLGFTPEATWTLIAVTRSIGTGAHCIEEIEREGHTRLGETLTPKDLYDGPGDRPVPPFAEGKQQAKPAQTHSLEEWKAEFERRKELNGSGYAIEEEIEDPSQASH
ncbi:MAG: citrate/2-methylcitrate synthase [Puniceicoccaceae bacterium]